MRIILLISLVACLSCGPNFNGLIMDKSNDLQMAVVSSRDMNLINDRVDALREKYDVRTVLQVENNNGVFTFAVYYYDHAGQNENDN